MRPTHDHWNTDTMKLGMSTVNIYTTESDRGGFAQSVDFAILSFWRYADSRSGRRFEKGWEDILGHFIEKGRELRKKEGLCGVSEITR